LLANYGYIGLFIIVAILFTVIMPLIPVILRYAGIIPHKPNTVKNSTFECGMETVGKTWVQFNFHYYYYALVFLTIDVLVVFLYPWAVNIRQLGVFSLTLVLILIFLILIGYIYAWKKKVLEWK
jgi:NADH-quinone oxidoreductase subunit A